LKSNIRFILTDIEGTTSSISFVADELFPYFREHIKELLDMTHLGVVREAMDEVVSIADHSEGVKLSTDEEIVETLCRWSVEDKKITPLKTLQGILWEKGYQNGELKGHVYPEVPGKLTEWHESGIGLGVFSSGSVAAQKLIFGYSAAGDLTPYFSHYFDTNTGGKREITTYRLIATKLLVEPADILFLSDVAEELQAAKDAGFQTVQLVREGTQAAWEQTARDFSAIAL
jgi:enolase-phosphatase E1